MRKLVVIAVVILGLFLLLGLGGGLGLYLWVIKDLPQVQTLSDYNPPLTTSVYSRNQEVLGYLAKEKRFLRSLDEMSDRVPQCFLAAEDHAFYEHEGIDLLGILRAAIKNIRAGAIVQGGSTITQQVIKALLLTPERSYERKLKEAILAYRLEKNLSKDEILTIYLNQIYLGHGAYGVEAASRIYFGKHVQDLTLAEAALLAGLPKAPSRYDPYDHMHRAKSRQRYVLNQLLSLDWISEGEYTQALEEEIVLQSMPDPSWKSGAFYLEEVRKWLVETFGQDRTYTGGLQVSTCVDLKHQQAAEGSLRDGLIASSKRRGWQGPVDHIPAKDTAKTLQGLVDQAPSWVPPEWRLVQVDKVSFDGAQVHWGNQTGRIGVGSMAWCREPNPKKAPENVRDIKDATKVLSVGDVVWASPGQDEDGDNPALDLNLEQIPRVQGALFSLHPETGDVLAMAGGFSFQQSQFNRAVQAKRQPGSAFKPIVYSAALDNGFTAASVLLDAPIVYEDRATNSTWKPENYEQRTFGRTLLRTALVKSRNLVTIRVARQIGIGTVISRGKELGLRAEFPRDLSVSLGSAAVSLHDLCRAYSAFARDGSTIQPRLVSKVTDSWGNVLYESEPQMNQAISAQTAFIITSLLQQVVQGGTGWRVRALGRPVAGKTGTTDEQRDAWFMGYAPYLLTGVFVGFDQPKPMGKYETGSRAASPIWLNYRQAVKDQYPVQDFTRPEGIVTAKVDVTNGLLAGPGTEKSYVLPFKAGTQPTRISPAQPKAGQKKTRQETGGSGDSKGKDVLKSLF